MDRLPDPDSLDTKTAQPDAMTTKPATSPVKNFQNFGQWDVALVPVGLRDSCMEFGTAPETQWNLRFLHRGLLMANITNYLAKVLWMMKFN